MMLVSIEITEAPNERTANIPALQRNPHRIPWHHLEQPGDRRIHQDLYLGRMHCQHRVPLHIIRDRLGSGCEDLLDAGRETSNVHCGRAGRLRLQLGVPLQ